MGIPLTPPPVSAVIAGDQANFIVSGKFTAIGPSLPAPMYGAFNVAIWGSATTTITTTAGSATATVASATGLAVGMSIPSVNVPRGTTIGVLSGTTITMAFPPGHTAAEVTAGSTVAITFPIVTTAATVSLERSFDGGLTWLTHGYTGASTAATYTNPASISTVFGEPEKGMAYRLNCTAYTSGTVNYRLSATGPMAISAGALTV